MDKTTQAHHELECDIQDVRYDMKRCDGREKQLERSYRADRRKFYVFNLYVNIKRAKE